jgi:hypothetical protein
MALNLSGFPSTRYWGKRAEGINVSQDGIYRKQGWGKVVDYGKILW